MNSFKKTLDICFAKILMEIFRPLNIKLESYIEPEFETHRYGKPDEFIHERKIPKKIWTYWTGKTPSYMIQQCFKNWKYYNPEYEINIITEDSLEKYVEKIPENLFQNSPARQSDWVRLAVLKDYGGIWLDASSILSQSLAWIHEEQRKNPCDFIGFYLKKFTRYESYPVIESWFMAAPPESPFITDSLSEFENQALPRTGVEYVEYLTSLGNFEHLRQNIDGLAAYLNIHLSMQRTLHSGKSYEINLQQAEKGPFYYHALSKWNRDRLRIRLLFYKTPEKIPPIIKLRGPDRKRTETYIEKNIYLPDSIADKYITRIQ